MFGRYLRGLLQDLGSSRRAGVLLAKYRLRPADQRVGQ